MMRIARAVTICAMLAVPSVALAGATDLMRREFFGGIFPVL
jgi:hypothetical protein